jgi:LacI family transcriptional regulator, galactose operon repressor
MPASAGRVTLAAVAASAGVSVPTVSKVLNSRSDVAPATRSRVQAALVELGYVHAPGRRPVEVPATVQVRTGGQLGAYAAEVIKGVIDAGTEAGAAVVVADGTDPGGDAWVRGLVASGRRAVITVDWRPSAAQLAALARTGLPAVVVDPVDPPPEPVASVGTTNFAGLAATQHLLDLGHRRIAYLGGPADAFSNQARKHGYRAAMESAGVPVPPGYVRSASYCYDDGAREAAALLDAGPAPTAIVAASEEIAVGTIHAATARGLSVPGDLSVVGFDDTEIAALSTPQLTTIHQPLREMGAVALHTALRLAAGDTIESRHLELATHLVVRASTKPPR